MISVSEIPVHLSIDDVEAFDDFVNDTMKYEDVFSHPFFNYLKGLHEKYNCSFTLYTYETYSSGNTIDQIPLRYKADFEQNCSWLKIAFHAQSPSVTKDEISREDDFCKSWMRTVDAIQRFAGECSMAHFVRLHYYYATEDELNWISTQQNISLLSADDERISYSLPKEKNDDLIRKENLEYNNLKLLKTDIRIEKVMLPQIELISNRNDDMLVIFTHEWALNWKNKLKFEYLIWILNLYNCNFICE